MNQHDMTEQAYRNGYHKGYDAGQKDGFKQGYKDGYDDGRRDAVKRGEWKLISHSKTEPVADYQCSRCGGILENVPDDTRHKLSDYCPMCGAKMAAGLVGLKNMSQAMMDAIEKVGQITHTRKEELVSCRSCVTCVDGGIDMPHCAECNPGNGFAYFRRKV